ncbi:MAG: glycine zipper 2TM domain-containing protein [Wenzhouxiangella sp.]
MRMAKAGLFMAAALATSLAQASGAHYIYAPVVHVKADYQTVHRPVERQVCWDEQSYERSASSKPRSATPTIVGAIIGGVIGNQFGGGSGNRAATVAGAALGGSIGHDAERQARGPDEYHRVTRERCTVQHDYQRQSVVSGYTVTYEYQGQHHTTHMTEHPGDQVRLRVSATPVP